MTTEEAPIETVSATVQEPEFYVDEAFTLARKAVLAMREALEKRNTLKAQITEVHNVVKALMQSREYGDEELGLEIKESNRELYKAAWDAELKYSDAYIKASQACQAAGVTIEETDHPELAAMHRLQHKQATKRAPKRKR